MTVVVPGASLVAAAVAAVLTCWIRNHYALKRDELRSARMTLRAELVRDLALLSSEVTAMDPTEVLRVLSDSEFDRGLDHGAASASSTTDPLLQP